MLPVRQQVPWTRQPPYPARIASSVRLLTGWSATDYWRDLTGGDVAIHYSPVKQIVSGEQMGYFGASQYSYNEIFLPSRPVFSQPFSIVVRYVLNATPQENGHIFSRAGHYPYKGAVWVCYDNASRLKVYFKAQADQSERTITSTSADVIGALNTAVYTYDGITHTLYQSDGTVTTLAGDGKWPGSGADDGYERFAVAGPGNYGWNYGAPVSVSFALAFHGAAPATQAWSLVRNPWQLFA